jgi:hypothetical protein
MAISDYIPNVFGVENPTYTGLLGQDQSNALRNSSNFAGLLGGAAALAQGMSGQGPRRSAALNIINALAGAYGAAGQQYQQGVQNYGQQQQLMMQQRQQAGVQAMRNKYPDLADEFDTNPAGAFRIVAEREAAAKKPIVVGNNLVSPTGDLIYQSPTDKKKNTAVVGNTLIDLDTGQPIYQGQKERKTTTVNGQLVDSETGQVIFGQPTKQAPEVKEFADGTTRQYDPTSGSWKILAKKPIENTKTMYASAPITDANGRLVFLPSRAGLPVLDAVTGAPIPDYKPKADMKPLPPVIQKAEDQDFETGQAAINLAIDTNKYINSIKSGAIQFGPLNKASTTIRGAFGSESPDVTARNDFESFKTRLVNESLRLNKGTQTEGDAVRAANELRSSDSAAGAGKAMQNLLDLNLRAAQDAQKSVLRRRANSKLGAPEVMLEIPNFEPHVFSDADYSDFLKNNKYPKGTIFVDPAGVRRVKP